MSDWRALQRKLDTGDMYGKIFSLPGQIEEAIQIAERASIDPLDPPDQLLFLGMGGSAIGGDIVCAAIRKTCPVPATVVRGYEVPASCGPGTLAIVTSYSGGTAETVAAASGALEKGARLVAITTGGDLEKIAREAGAPVVLVPGGFPPRSAIGYLTIPQIVAVEAAGLISDGRSQIREAADLLARLRLEWGVSELPGVCEPSSIAERIAGSFPIVYHADGEMTPAATRLCGQLAENAKSLSHRHAFPELNHNEIVGWDNPHWLLPRSSLLILRNSVDDVRTANGMDAAIDLLADLPKEIIPIPVAGKSPMARIFAAVYFGDLISYYLALVNNVDPTPVRRIDRLKAVLART